MVIKMYRKHQAAKATIVTPTRTLTMTIITIQQNLEEPPVFQPAKVSEQIKKGRATLWTQRPTGGPN